MVSVLYVDDESDLLALGKLFLEQDGSFSVDILPSAREALLRLESKQYDAIISDFQMPGINGIEFLHRVRASGNTIPFIIFTGRSREEIVIQALNEGADFYLQKGGEPVSQFAELQHKIRMAVERHSIGKALRENETRFRALIENASDIIRILDREGRISFDGTAAERLLGYPPGFTIGRNPLEFIHPDDFETVKRDIAEVYNNTNIGIPTEFRIRKADGSYTYVESRAKNLIGVPGIDGIVVTTRIIDERKNAEEAKLKSAEELHAAYEELLASEEELRHNVEKRTRQEEELRKSEERYRNVVEDQTEFISRFLPDGMHVFVNEAYCRYFGLNRGEILGHRFRPAIPPGDQERLKRFFSSLTPEHPVDSIEHRIIMPDGSVRWQRWSDRGIFDPAGNLIEYQSVGRDITEHKRSEEELRAVQEKYTKAFLAVPDAITISDLDSGRFIEVNDAATALFGYSRDELIGKSASELGIWLREEDRAAFIDQLMKHGRIHGYEVVQRRKSGELYDALVNADILTIGSRQCFIAITRDITERKRTERAMAETARKIEILTSITRHDVANQVTILRGFARIALKQKPDPGIAELLLKIDTAGSTIARQIAFTRTYQELGVHTPGWYRIREIATQQKPEGITLSCTCDAEIFTDPMIERVFFNLFENAVRHGERVTGIDVRCRTDSGRLVITFEDDGVGIPADQKETIFEKGYGRNTGFGLFLAREILAITGIAIHETGIPGTGARFEITVPAGMYRIAEGPAK